MELVLKLKLANFLEEEGRERERDLIDAVQDGKMHKVKLTANQLLIERDNRDERNIKSLKKVKMVFQMSKGGCLILIGNLGLSFREPYGGEFYVTNAIAEEKSFKEINGVDLNVQFNNMYPPTGIDTMFSYLEQISKDKDFVYNISQFDEFMEIFKYYREISSQLNNNVSYEIKVSYPYYFVSVNEKEIQKEIDINGLKPIVNSKDIIAGYRLKKHLYENLPEDLQDNVRTLVDIKILDRKAKIEKINRFAQNLYLSAENEITDNNSKQLCSVDLVNVCIEENMITLSCELKINGDYNKYRYLHLYDMGQKIKLESINNSLKLINQGETGSAAELLEYLIGSKEMPNKRIKRRSNDGKDKYLEGLDESQKAAFLMATDLSPVSLIKGPPGTGKTHVINAIVQYITKELKQKVIISSQTHVAIDNVLDKIMENYDLIIPNRITNRRNRYSGIEIDSTLYKTWAKKFESHNRRSRNKDLANLIADDMRVFNGENKFRFSESVNISDYSVIGATTTTSAIGGKRGLDLFDGYDWLIIDEVSKCPITEVLRYLPYVSKIIMVGDDFQLAPLLEFDENEVKNLECYDADKFSKLKALYENSVFSTTLEKAEKAGRLEMLKTNYRSVCEVLNTYNVFYGGKLVNKRECIKPEKVGFKKEVFNINDVFFVDVKHGKEANAEGSPSRYNVEELDATKCILMDLIENTIDAGNVTVSAIFPYAAQIEQFQRKNADLINRAKKIFKSFEIDTVDAFQGRETDIVLVNTVVTDETRGNFLSEFRRINVAMSRARDKLFIFGNRITLSRIQMKIPSGGKRQFLKDIIDYIERSGKMIEYDGGIKYEYSSKTKIKIN